MGKLIFARVNRTFRVTVIPPPPPKTRSYKIRFPHNNFCAQLERTRQLTFQDLMAKIAITFSFFV
jgi:hypothetical protein